MYLRSVLRSSFDFARLACVVTSQPIGGSDTVFDNIFRVPAGVLVRLSENGERLEFQRSYERFRQPLTVKSVPDLAQELYRLFDERARQFSGRDVGVILSGGVDSSAALAALSRHARKTIAYHWDFAGMNQIDEREYAEAVANRFGVELHSFSAISVIDRRSYSDLRYPPSHVSFAHMCYPFFEETALLVRGEVEFITTGHLSDMLYGGPLCLDKGDHRKRSVIRSSVRPGCV